MAKILSAADFKLLFEKAPEPYLVLDRDLYIVAVSEAYLAATVTTREGLLGRYIFEAFPDNPDEAGATGVRNLRESLEYVLENNRPHAIAVQKYDIRVPGPDGRTLSFEERYWSPVNTPVLDDHGELQFIIHRVQDLTEFVKLKQSEQESKNLKVEAYAKSDQLEREMFQRAVEIQEQSRQLRILNEELKVARDKAIDSSKFKSEFLASMSHEIRTPMNGIMGMASILLRQGLPSHLQEHVLTIRDAGTSLLTVINSILDLSKIEAGKLELDIAEFDPVKLVESVADLLSEQAHEKRVLLVPFVCPSIPRRLLGDVGRLRQIIVNLTGNAIKFSDHNEVQIKAELLDRNSKNVLLKFSVADRGIGLSEKELEKLFQPFAQSETTVNKSSGTGLGLSISKRLAELMAGEMGVESKKGQGSTFWFTVRLRLLDDEKVTEDQAKKQEAVQNISPFNNFEGVRVLIVDDEDYLLEALAQYTSAWGMVTTKVHSAREGLKKLIEATETSGKTPYQIVIADLLMPGMNGIDMARAIREDSRICNTKLVLLTANGKHNTREQALSLGFDASLNKPFKQSQLFTSLNSLLEQPPVADCPGAVHRQAATVHRAPEGADADSESDQITRPELILVVEDHRINQQVALLVLRSLGFEAHTAETGQVAMECLNTHDYALIFMDVQMPIMNGYETTQAIRRKEQITGRHIPIIAMTAHVTAGSREDCLTAGMDDYLPKPITPEEVQAMLNKWLPV
ncbi:MAG: response regulator [Cyanobacteria bacterium SZAS LIN-3]|nr:response regulator [Cyanobacteria bacterium SZAS LIN-3]